MYDLTFVRWRSLCLWAMLAAAWSGPAQAGVAGSVEIVNRTCYRVKVAVYQPTCMYLHGQHGSRLEDLDRTLGVGERSSVYLESQSTGACQASPQGFRLRLVPLDLQTGRPMTAATAQIVARRTAPRDSLQDHFDVARGSTHPNLNVQWGTQWGVGKGGRTLRLSIREWQTPQPSCEAYYTPSTSKLHREVAGLVERTEALAARQPPPGVDECRQIGDLSQYIWALLDQVEGRVDQDQSLEDFLRRRLTKAQAALEEHCSRLAPRAALQARPQDSPARLRVVAGPCTAMKASCIEGQALAAGLLRLEVERLPAGIAAVSAGNLPVQVAQLKLHHDSISTAGQVAATIESPQLGARVELALAPSQQTDVSKATPTLILPGDRVRLSASPAGPGVASGTYFLELDGITGFRNELGKVDAPGNELQMRLDAKPDCAGDPDMDGVFHASQCLQGQILEAGSAVLHVVDIGPYRAIFVGDKPVVVDRVTLHHGKTDWAGTLSAHIVSPSLGSHYRLSLEPHRSEQAVKNTRTLLRRGDSITLDSDGGHTGTGGQYYLLLEGISEFHNGMAAQH